MSTQVIVRKLNKEVKTLRRDVAEIKSVLLRALAIPEENSTVYRDASHIKKSFRKALKKHPIV